MLNVRANPWSGGHVTITHKMLASIEHSENKIIAQSGLFENEIGPGVLSSSVQQPLALRECERSTCH